MQCVGCRDRHRIIRFVSLRRCSFFSNFFIYYTENLQSLLFFSVWRGWDLLEQQSFLKSKKPFSPSAVIFPSHTILHIIYIKYLNFYSHPCIPVPLNTLILMRKYAMLSVIIPFNCETKCPMEIFQYEHTCCLLLNNQIFIAVTCFLT